MICIPRARAQIITKFHYAKVLKPEKLTHHTTMEVIWTIIPTLIVVMIAIPSLTLIYSLDQHTERPGTPLPAAHLIRAATWTGTWFARVHAACAVRTSTCGVTEVTSQMCKHLLC